MKPVAKRLIIVLIILMTLLLAAEIGLTLAAQKGLAVYLRNRFSLLREPSVSISGFPLTVNALRGRVNSTRVIIRESVAAHNLAGVTLDMPYELTFDAMDARFSLSDLLSGHLKLTSVGGLQGGLTLTQHAMSAFVAGSGWGIVLEGNNLYVVPDAQPSSRIECKVYVHDSSTLALEPRSSSAFFPSDLTSGTENLLLRLPLASLPLHPILLSAEVAEGNLTLKARLDQNELVKSGF